MYILLITMHVISCIVLILVILLQSGRGGGLSETFGSTSTSTIFGTNAATFLQRATSACAIIFLLTSLTLTILSSHKSRSLMEMENMRRTLPRVDGNAASPPEEEPAQDIPLGETQESFPVEE
jgi:preprotein translocase subunit SecG